MNGCLSMLWIATLGPKRFFFIIHFSLWFIFIFTTLVTAATVVSIWNPNSFMKIRIRQTLREKKEWVIKRERERERERERWVERSSSNWLHLFQPGTNENGVSVSCFMQHHGIENSSATSLLLPHHALTSCCHLLLFFFLINDIVTSSWPLPLSFASLPLFYFVLFYFKFPYLSW